MKLFRLGHLLLIALTLCIAAGCKKKPTPLTQIPGRTGETVGDPGLGNAIGQTDPGATSTSDLNAGVEQPGPGVYGGPRDEKIFEDYTVHFAYDSHAVRAGEKSKIAAVADYLKANPANGLEIEGHCDERGTDQYNYSLGDRRALAIREELMLLGVDGGRILTKSYGRSRPVDTSGTEAARAKNRRGVFILLSK